jgi:nucleoside-diphosphate-sugar epimerase
VILLTGATGLVGRQVAELLLARGSPVTALVRDVNAASWLTDRGARLVTGAITDRATWAGIDGISAVVHSAAVIAGGRSWEEFAGPNINATSLAAERARVLGVPFVHLSSVAVYGGTTTLPPGSVTEDHPFAPMRDGAWYGRSKREAELTVWREAERGLRAIALRPCVIYGPHDRLFLPGLVRSARRRVLPLIGAGDRPMAIVHARSVAEAVLAALDSKAGWGRSYNVTGDGAITPRQVVTALSRGLGHTIWSPSLPAGLVLGAAKVGDKLASSLLPPGRFPGTLTTGVGYWRGGDPYVSEAARTTLGWRPQVDHAAEIERLSALQR